MSEKKYFVYLPTSDKEKKLYASLSQGETVWDLTTDIEWANVYSLYHARLIKDVARAELGLELTIEEYSEEVFGATN